MSARSSRPLNKKNLQAFGPSDAQKAGVIAGDRCGMVIALLTQMFLVTRLSNFKPAPIHLMRPFIGASQSMSAKF
jgi:hypothetical protein